VDHIAIQVRRIDDVLATNGAPPAWRITGREVVGQTDIVMLEGTPNIELIAPVDGVLGTRAPGPHHVAVVVANANDVLRRLDAAGVRVRDKTSRPGFLGHAIGFLYPDAYDGVLYEVVEHVAKR
jgi:hypothetical protein